MKITLEHLKAEQACADQVARFQALFGDSVEATRDLCIKHAGDFDFRWAAQHLLSDPARAAYRAAATLAACAVYRKSVTAPYMTRADDRAAYEVARASAFFDALQL